MPTTTEARVISSARATASSGPAAEGAATPAPGAGPARVAEPSIDVPLLTEPCTWVRRATRELGWSDDRWVATQVVSRSGDAKWDRLRREYPLIPTDALRAAQCVAAAGPKRAIAVAVAGMPTTQEAVRLLANDAGAGGLGDQLDIGDTEKGGSSFMRVGRVWVSVVVFYDGEHGTKIQPRVRAVLELVEPGLHPS